MTLDHPVRSGLCHGPDCQAKITDESQSEDFCSPACQARWQYRGSAPSVRPKRSEALRLDLSLGARHHLSGGVYEVTATDGRNATLTPIEDHLEA
jgi:hypothetical protein